MYSFIFICAGCGYELIALSHPHTHSLPTPARNTHTQDLFTVQHAEEFLTASGNMRLQGEIVGAQKLVAISTKNLTRRIGGGGEGT
jgi:hypothetical protein